MIEGLASGGVLVSEVMTALPMYFEDRREELAEVCVFIDSVPPQCFRGTPFDGYGDEQENLEAAVRLAREKPECADKWSRFKEALGSLESLEQAIGGNSALNEIARRDRAILKSADVD